MTPPTQRDLDTGNERKVGFAEYGADFNHPLPSYLSWPYSCSPRKEKTKRRHSRLALVVLKIAPCRTSGKQCVYEHTLDGTRGELLSATLLHHISGGCPSLVCRWDD